MATKGMYYSHPSGTDGSDHTYRQKIARQYAISVLNKSRLKYCMLFHYLLFFVMLAKLSADILDKLDIFVLEIEELALPQALLWEYIWCIGLFMSFVGLSAIKENRVKLIKRYIWGLCIFGVAPLLYATIYYFSDVWIYLTSNDDEQLNNIIIWQGYSYALLWYAFILLGFQVHLFSIKFAWNLINAWSKSSKQT